MGDRSVVLHVRIINPPGSNSSSKALQLSSTVNTNAKNLPIVRAALCAGLYQNVVKAVNPKQQYAEKIGGAFAVDPQAHEIKFYCQSGEQQQKMLHVCFQFYM